MTVEKKRNFKLIETKTDSPMQPFEVNSDLDSQLKSLTTLTKTALITALLSFVLMAILFFGLSQNINGLGEEVKRVDKVSEDLGTMQTMMEGVFEHQAGVDERLNNMEAVSREEAQKVLMQATLDDMQRKAESLNVQLENEEQKQKMAQIQDLLQELNSSNRLVQ